MPDLFQQRLPDLPVPDPPLRVGSEKNVRIRSEAGGVLYDGGEAFFEPADVDY